MLTCYSEIRDVDGLQCDLPHKPYCSDCLEAGVAIRPLMTALRHKYIELNPPHVKKFIKLLFTRRESDKMFLVFKNKKEVCVLAKVSRPLLDQMSHY